MGQTRHLLLLLLLLSLPVLEAKRGGGMGGMGRSRGSSGARTGGGWGSGGGGSRPSGGSSGGSSGGLFGGGASRTSSSGGTGGGWMGGGSSNTNLGRKQGGQGWGHNTGGGRSTFTSGGIGSRSRTSMLKNAVVGAAAGYLTYQAGKAIIRHMARPMMWNNRPYYWDQSYYNQMGGGRHGNSKMCRMPIESGDPNFGNIYTDNTMSERPREIVWGCSAYEYCCGYECCRGGDAAGYGYGLSVGSLIMLAVMACCCFGLLAKYCMRANIFHQQMRGNVRNQGNKYTAGQQQNMMNTAYQGPPPPQQITGYPPPYST